ncbi:MAG: hypothetical protein WCE21_01265 [Candidatus Babeliales bacterium]
MRFKQAQFFSGILIGFTGLVGTKALAVSEFVNVGVELNLRRMLNATEMTAINTSLQGVMSKAQSYAANKANKANIQAALAQISSAGANIAASGVAPAIKNITATFTAVGADIAAGNYAKAIADCNTLKTAIISANPVNLSGAQLATFNSIKAQIDACSKLLTTLSTL